MSAAYLKGGTKGTGVVPWIDPNPQCTGKVRFESAVVANKAARRRKNRVAYRCNRCGAFHVGADVPGTSRTFRVALVRSENA